jgi:hypothetical protein
MLRRVALVRTDVSEEINASFIRVTGIGSLAFRALIYFFRGVFLARSFILPKFFPAFSSHVISKVCASFQEQWGGVNSVHCKIWGFHGGDYEECRVLGYKNPVRTSQETLRVRYTAHLVNAMSDLKFSRRWLWRMPSSETLCHVALVRADILEERIASIIKVTRISEQQDSVC